MTRSIRKPAPRAALLRGARARLTGNYVSLSLSLRDKFWNSRQRIDSDYTVDARASAEAMYPEGNLSIRVIVEDIRGNQTTY